MNAILLIAVATALAVPSHITEPCTLDSAILSQVLAASSGPVVSNDAINPMNADYKMALSCKNGAVDLNIMNETSLSPSKTGSGYIHVSLFVPAECKEYAQDIKASGNDNIKIVVPTSSLEPILALCQKPNLNKVLKKLEKRNQAIAGMYVEVNQYLEWLQNYRKTHALSYE